LSSAIVSGKTLVASTYSTDPIFAVPEGKMRFCTLTDDRETGERLRLDAPMSFTVSAPWSELLTSVNEGGAGGAEILVPLAAALAGTAVSDLRNGDLGTCKSLETQQTTQVCNETPGPS
jgi:hypothetical protein